MLSSSEVKKIIATGLGGFMVASLLGLSNIMVDKKMITEINAPCNNIAAYDKQLLSLLSALQSMVRHEHTQQHLLRLVATCDELIAMEHGQNYNQFSKSNGLLLLNRAKQIVESFFKTPKFEEVSQQIIKQMLKHYDNINLCSH